MVQQRLVWERLELMTMRTNRLSKSALLLIGAVTTAGATAVAIRLPDAARWTSVDLIALAALAAAGVLGEAFSVQVRFGHETKHVTLTETAYAAALLLGVRTSVLTAAVVLGIVVAYAARGTRAHKVAYNAASYALAVTAAEAIFSSMHGVSSLLAIAAAMTAFFVVNASTVVGVIALATGKRFAEVFRPIARLEATHAVGNLALGMVAAAVWATSPIAIPSVLLAAVLILLGYRTLSAVPARLPVR